MAAETDAGRVWTAAAAAWSWAASVHHLALWESCRSAWAAMAEASMAGRNTADVGAEAVGRDGQMNGTALGNGAAALGAAIQAQLRARAAFRVAAEQAEHSAAGWKRAAKAHARAGNASLEAKLRGQADLLIEAGQAADKWASHADRDADITKRAQRQWEECAGRWAHGGVYKGDRTEWVDEQARILADAEYSRAKWTDKAEKAGETAQMAAGDLKEYAELAGKIATAAGLPGDVPPGAERAARAWRNAIKSARRAARTQCHGGDRTA